MIDDKREVYRSWLQRISLFGTVILALVLFNSLRVDKPESEQEKLETEKAAPVLVDLQTLLPGTIKTAMWKDIPVGILYRRDTIDEIRLADTIENERRSLHPAFFVFINASGVVRCPLHINPQATELTDSCAGVVFDTAGRVIRGSGQDLQIPPHHYADDQSLVIGSWRSVADVQEPAR